MTFYATFNVLNNKALKTLQHKQKYYRECESFTEGKFRAPRLKHFRDFNSHPLHYRADESYSWEERRASTEYEINLYLAINRIR